VPLGRNAQMHSARRNAWRHCSVSRRRHGAGAREAAEEQRLTGAGTADGGVTSTGEATVGTAARSARRLGGGRCGRGDGSAREAVGTRVARARRVLSATAAARRAGRLSGGRDAVEAAVGTRGG
jgi:hypothetical protein